MTRQLTLNLALAVKHGALHLRLQQALENVGFNVALVNDSTALLSLLEAMRPAFILLEWRLKDMGALGVCRMVRTNPALKDTRIIILGEAGDHGGGMTVALEAGADDYLARPYDVDDILARIAALQRQPASAHVSRVLKAGGIRMLPDEWVVYVEGKTVNLTEIEYRLLHELLQVKGRVLTREFLLERVWGHQKAFKIETRTVDVHMSRLRNKLGSCARNIMTVRNIGYRINLASDWMG